MTDTPAPADEHCYWHKFGGGHPCSAKPVGPLAGKVGNQTDEWVWCEEHGGIPKGADHE